MPISSSILTIFLAASRKYKSLGRLARCMIELEIAALPWINLTAGASREERRGGEASSSHGRDGEGKLFARTVISCVGVGGGSCGRAAGVIIKVGRWRLMELRV